MMKDADPAVRAVVAQRLAPALLAPMIADADWQVRYAVAQRIDSAALWPLLDDEDEAVREAARLRHANPSAARNELQEGRQ